MIRIVVNVMLKPEILDPQGQAIARALPRLGFDGVASVRQGKRFDIEFTETSEPPAVTDATGLTDVTEPREPAAPDGSDAPPELTELTELTEPVESTQPVEPEPVEADDRPVPAPRTELTEEDALARARQIAATLLANPVIEDFEVRVVQ